jgi:PKD repeat protein
MDSWDWDFGDGGTSTNQSPLHTYASAGVYSVSLKVKKGSCEDTCPGTVEVKEKLDCSWTSNAPVCNGTPVQFTGPAGMDSFQWSFGDGVVSSAKDPAHLYSAPKTYAVSLTVTKGSCSKSCPGTVVVKPQPGDCWTSNSPVCIGTAVVFDAPSGMDKYVWDFDDGARSYEEDPVHLYSAPGKYLVVLTMGKDGHIRSCPGYVVVKSLTDCGMTSHAPAPNGTAAQLAAPSGIGSNPGELGDGRVSSRENRVRIYPG